MRLTLNTLFTKFCPEEQEVSLRLDGARLDGTADDLNLLMNEKFLESEVTDLEAEAGVLKVWATSVNVEE